MLAAESFFNRRFGKRAGCPTKRAVDGGDSAAFSGFIYTRTESWSWSFIYARPTATNASRWAAVAHKKSHATRLSSRRVRP